MHSDCKPNIRHVRLHLLLCQVLLGRGVGRSGRWKTAATIGAESTG